MARLGQRPCRFPGLSGRPVAHLGQHPGSMVDLPTPSAPAMARLETCGLKLFDALDELLALLGQHLEIGRDERLRTNSFTSSKPPPTMPPAAGPSAAPSTRAIARSKVNPER